MEHEPNSENIEELPGIPEKLATELQDKRQPWLGCKLTAVEVAMGNAHDLDPPQQAHVETCKPCQELIAGSADQQN